MNSPNGVLDHIDSRVITALLAGRQICGVPFIPSPVFGAHVRFDGSKTSQHYAMGRLSTGTDFFCAHNSDAHGILNDLQRVPDINGIGVLL